MMTDKGALLVREEGVDEILASSDPIVSNLLRLCVAEARMRCMRDSNIDEVVWRKGLPIAPFDMEFFASVLCASLGRRAIVEKILQGATIAEASGWDV